MMRLRLAMPSARTLRRLGIAAALGAALFAVQHFEGLRAPVAERLAQAKRDMGLVIRHVEVEGRRNAPEAALEQAIGPVKGLAADAVDLAALKARLEALAWVERAEVERRLPDGLSVQITERTPFALWQHEGRLVLIDAGGTVLTDRYLARWRELPLLVGEGAPEAARALLAVLAQDIELAAGVEAAIRVGGRRWDLKMANGILLRLPAEGEAYGPAQAWKRMSELERRHGLLSRDIAAVDLRLPDRLVVRLTPEGRALVAVAEEQST